MNAAVNTAAAVSDSRGRHAGAGLLALLAPLGGSRSPASRVGVLLAIAATLRALHSPETIAAAAPEERRAP
jgi:hypothetical protein